MQTATVSTPRRTQAVVPQTVQISRDTVKCPVCSKEYVPSDMPKHLAYTCDSPKCRKEYARLYSQAYNRPGAPFKPLDRCEICGHLYMKTRRTRRTCGSVNCRDEAYRRYLKEYGQKNWQEQKKRIAATRPEKHFSVCEICGKSFIARNSLQVTCGAIKCQDERHRLLRAEAAIRRERGGADAPPGSIRKTCVICHQEFWATNNRQIKCFSPSCKTEYMRRKSAAHRANNNGEPLRTEPPEMRECLMCYTMFLSPGKQVRRCPKCQAWVEEQGW